jgi:hypothetical protein
MRPGPALCCLVCCRLHAQMLARLAASCQRRVHRWVHLLGRARSARQKAGWGRKDWGGRRVRNPANERGQHLPQPAPLIHVPSTPSWNQIPSLILAFEGFHSRSSSVLGLAWHLYPFPSNNTWLIQSNAKKDQYHYLLYQNDERATICPRWAGLSLCWLLVYQSKSFDQQIPCFNNPPFRPSTI